MNPYSHYAKFKRTDTEEYTLFEIIYMKRKTDLCQQEANQWLLQAEGAKRTFGSDAMVHQPTGQCFSLVTHISQNFSTIKIRSYLDICYGC